MCCYDRSVSCLSVRTLRSSYSLLPSLSLSLPFRDYRWYASDLIHPSEQAQSIIFQRFSECFLSDRAQQSLKAISALQGAVPCRITYASALVVSASVSISVVMSDLTSSSSINKCHRLNVCNLLFDPPPPLCLLMVYTFPLLLLLCFCSYTTYLA